MRQLHSAVGTRKLALSAPTDILAGHASLRNSTMVGLNLTISVIYLIFVEASAPVNQILFRSTSVNSRLQRRRIKGVHLHLRRGRCRQQRQAAHFFRPDRCHQQLGKHSRLLLRTNTRP